MGLFSSKSAAKTCGACGHPGSADRPTTTVKTTGLLGDTRKGTVHVDHTTDPKSGLYGAK